MSLLVTDHASWKPASAHEDWLPNVSLVLEIKVQQGRYLQDEWENCVHTVKRFSSWNCTYRFNLIRSRAGPSDQYNSVTAYRQ
jgi:hypothetical protein